MKKQFLLLAVIICLSNFLFGTGDLYITLKGLSINPTNGNYYIKEVIDVRLDKELLGYVTTEDPRKSTTTAQPNFVDFTTPLPGGVRPYKAKFEKNYPIRFERDLFTELRDAGLSPESPENKRIPLVMKINHIFLSEVVSNNIKYVCVEVNIDFYTSGNDTYYLEYTYGNGIFLQCPLSQKKKTEIFAANLADQINQAFQAFHKAMDDKKNYHLAVDKSELHRREVKLPLNPGSEKNGIFRSYHDFRDGILETDIRLSITDASAESNCEVLQFEILDDLNVSQDVWGVQYNQQYYYNLNGYYFRLVMENGAYYSHGAKDLQQRYSDQNIINNIRTSGVIAWAVLAGGHNSTFSITINETEEILPFKIDHFSGLVWPELDFDARNFEGNLLFYARKTKNKDPELWINNTFHCKFKPDTYYEIKVSARDEPVEVTLVTGNNKTVEVLEDVIFNVSFYEIDYKRRKFVLFPKRGIVSRKTVLSDIENGRLVKVDAISNDPKND